MMYNRKRKRTHTKQGGLKHDASTDHREGHRLDGFTAGLDRRAIQSLCAVD
jgi:hypothetical protein